MAIKRAAWYREIYPGDCYFHLGHDAPNVIEAREWKPLYDKELVVSMAQMLDRCRQYAYNHFEPNNQGEHYKKLNEFLKGIGWNG